MCRECERIAMIGSCMIISVSCELWRELGPKDSHSHEKASSPINVWSLISICPVRWPYKRQKCKGQNSIWPQTYPFTRTHTLQWQTAGTSLWPWVTYININHWNNHAAPQGLSDMIYYFFKKKNLLYFILLIQFILIN